MLTKAEWRLLTPAQLVRAVCISCGGPIRLEQVMEHSGLSEKEALKAIRKGLKEGLLCLSD